MLGDWPLHIATEAKNLLRGRTLKEVKAIAAAVDSVILAEVPMTIAANPDYDPFGGQMGKLKLQHLPPDLIASFIRRDFGDLGLFNAAGGVKAIARGYPLRPDFDFPNHQAFATFALWKLLDAHDELAKVDYFGSGPMAPMDQLIPYSNISYLSYGATLVVEAAIACATATQLRVRSETVKAFHETTKKDFLTRLAEDDQRRAQEKSSQATAAAKERWKDRDRHRAMAVSFAVARPFKSRAEAARQAKNFLEKTLGGDKYTVKTVDDWLAADGWKKAG